MVMKPIFSPPPDTVPQRTSPSTFAPRMDRWLRWDSIERAKFPILVEFMEDRANRAEAAAAAAAVAAQAASRGAWVSDASYAQGDVVYSEVDFLPYRAKVAHTGQTTDPSADPAHWGVAVIVVVQSDPQDATPGALMPVGAFGLGSDDPPLISDFGAARRPGFYRYYEHTAVGSPGSEAFYGAAIVGNADGGRQFIIAARAASTIADTRVWFGANGWPSGQGSVQWLELFHSKNLVGAVSQDGGVATGAAFEPGQNSNGRYVRLADGTMLAWLDSLTLADDGTTAWVYPAAFVDTPAVSATHTGAAGAVTLRIASVGQSFADGIEAVEGGHGAAATVSMMAIGRWA